MHNADLKIVVDPGSPTPSDKLGWQKRLTNFTLFCRKLQYNSQMDESVVLLVSIINDLGLYVPK